MTIDNRKIRSGIILILGLFLYAGQAAAEPAAIRDILQKGIMVNFSGDYDRAADIFATASRLDPADPSAEFYQAVALFWKSSVAATGPQVADRIRQHLEKSIALSEQLVSADQNDLHALHYLGLAYTYLGRLEAHHGHMYKGGVMGERGRKHLERALEICNRRGCYGEASDSATCRPCEDLYFPLGAYSYFAGRLPQFLKAVNFLWFIPSGSTEEGLDALQRAAVKSDLHRLGAKSLLSDIFLNFETHRIGSAKTLSGDLVRHFPDNPYIELQHAGILMAAGQDRKASENAGKIIEKVDQGLRNYDVVVRQRALQITAEAAIRQKNTHKAKEILTQLRNTPAYQNNSLTPRTDLLLGMLADIEKNRKKAARFYEKAKSYKGTMRNRLVARKAGEYLKEPYTNYKENAS